MVNLQVGWLAGEVRIKPPSHAGDGVAEVTRSWHNIIVEATWSWVVARYRYRIMLVMAMLSRTDDDVVEAMLVVARCRF
jgi:hypothetical protein